MRGRESGIGVGWDGRHKQPSFRRPSLAFAFWRAQPRRSGRIHSEIHCRICPCCHLENPLLIVASSASSIPTPDRLNSSAWCLTSSISLLHQSLIRAAHEYIFKFGETPCSQNILLWLCLQILFHFLVTFLPVPLVPSLRCFLNPESHFYLFPSTDSLLLLSHG